MPRGCPDQLWAGLGVAARGQPEVSPRISAVGRSAAGGPASQLMSEPAHPDHRDVAAFDLRAVGYEDGWRGQLHREITTRTAALAAREAHAPSRILDVGCGTGQLLRLLATTFPTASALRGLDPAPSMLAGAATHAHDPRLSFDAGAAEELPYPDGHFDLVVTTTSFDHWSDQAAGLKQCARVLDAGGLLV